MRELTLTRSSVFFTARIACSFQPPSLASQVLTVLTIQIFRDLPLTIRGPGQEENTRVTADLETVDHLFEVLPDTVEGDV